MTDRGAAYTSARADVVELVPPDARRVLELGCSTGATARLLMERQAAEVVGVERDPEYAEAAGGVMDRVVVHDLDDPTWADAVGGPFDSVIAADVLEHLVDPWSVLRAAAGKLRPGGSVILSLPNIRHLQSVVGLARGRWPYRARGVHDATHLRHFTLRGIRGLTAVAGLTIESVVRHPRFLDRPSPFDRLAGLLLYSPLRELVTYQYLIRARPADSDPTPPPESVPPWTEPG